MKLLLLELGVEELPAGFIQPALNQLSQLLIENLAKERVNHGEIRTYSTPRRLAVIIKDVAAKQADLAGEVRGPAKNIAYKDGEPTQAALGFARSQGVAVTDLTIKDLKGVEYVFAHKFAKGQATKLVLTRMLPVIIASLSFPKNMRWGNFDLRFARPLRWITALLDNDIIKFSVENIVSSNISYGHRQLAVEPITINHAKEYLTALASGYVIADHHQRKQLVQNQIDSLAPKTGGQVFQDEALVHEVTNLVEYPTAFVGCFEQQFLSVPQEVLITTMKEHQRYFPIHDQNGQLLAKFIGVRNGTDNHLEQVVAGNEKVLKARLQDAKFFFDEDVKNGLETFLEKLKSVVFHEGLGSMYDKVKRIEQNSKTLISLLNMPAQQDLVLRAARLAKADLVTNMVYEFPELQGVMGKKYALLSGEHPAVAEAIAEHYKPRFSGDTLPLGTPGIIVGLADKLDNLVGYFGLGLIPTGSQDPFALRRQAIGIVQVLLVNDIDIGLSQLIDLALEGYQGLFENKTKIKQELMEFFNGRLRIVLQDLGYRYDTINAVLATSITSLPTLKNKISSLEGFRQAKEFDDLYTAFDRCSRLAIVKKSLEQTGWLDLGAFTIDDQNFLKAIEDTETKYSKLEGLKEYTQCLNLLASFRLFVDKFFEAVMIMDPDEIIRNNRLALLRRVTTLYSRYADFSLIVMDM